MPHSAAGIYYEQNVVDGLPPLLYLMGSDCDLRRDIPFRAHLTQSFSVLAFDYRGMGRSRDAALPAPASGELSAYADDALALLDELGLTAVHVVGVSFGGMVAQILASMHPSRVRSLALCVTTTGARMTLRSVQDLPLEERMRRTCLLIDTRRDDAWADTVAGRGAFERLLSSRRDEGNAAGFASQMRAREGFDGARYARAIRVATIVVAGRYDGIAPPEACSELCALVDGAECWTYDCGHDVAFSCSDAWRDVRTLMLGCMDAGSLDE